MKIVRRSAWILITALASCGPAPLPGAEEPLASTAVQPLDGVRLQPVPPIDNPPAPVRVATERLVWTRDTTIEVWTIDQWGGVFNRRSLARPGQLWWATGTAGDRLLVAREDSDDAQLWTLDSSNNFVSSVALTSPAPSFRANGLSLETTPGTSSCYHRGDSQNYWVTWDEPVSRGQSTRDMAIRTIGGDGHIIQTEQVTKPDWMTAYAFGLGPDDHMHVLFATFGTFAEGSLYNVDWIIGNTTTASHYQLTAPAPGTGELHVSGFQPTSRSLWKMPPSTFIRGGGSAKGERMLLTSLAANSAGNDRAYLAAFNDWAQAQSARIYELTGRGLATAYTWLPAVCP
jgi:hypothetical protein